MNKRAKYRWCSSRMRFLDALERRENEPEGSRPYAWLCQLNAAKSGTLPRKHTKWRELCGPREDDLKPLDRQRISLIGFDLGGWAFHPLELAGEQHEDDGICGRSIFEKAARISLREVIAIVSEAACAASSGFMRDQRTPARGANASILLQSNQNPGWYRH
ncbi:MAG: hypothetical protein U1G07_02950 [Verrucomicrobiota bacterium]